MHNTSEHDDLLSMLKNLGFKKGESQKRAAWAIAQAGENAPLDVLVKLALQSQAATATPPSPAPRAQTPKPTTQEPRALVRIPEVVEEDVYVEGDEEEGDYADRDDVDDEPPPPPRRRSNNRPKPSRPTRSHSAPAGVGLRQPLTLPVEANPNSNYYITVVYECSHGAGREQPKRRNRDRGYERPERAYSQDSQGRRQLTMGRGLTAPSMSKPKPQKDSDILEFNWHLALTCAAGVIVLKWLNII